MDHQDHQDHQERVNQLMFHTGCSRERAESIIRRNDRKAAERDMTAAQDEILAGMRYQTEHGRES
jgi:hypothetical protein